MRDNDMAFELECCLGADDVESFLEEGEVDVEPRLNLDIAKVGGEDEEGGIATNDETVVEEEENGELKQQ